MKRPRMARALCVAVVLGGVLCLGAGGAASAATPFVNETADGSVNNLGYYVSLALDAQGNPHVSYFDDATGDLKYARKSGGVWTIETADGSANYVGLYTSLALDAQGNPHVSYLDNTTGDLKYARKSGGVWTIEIADGSANQVGLEGCLALDAQGNPHVCYRAFTGPSTSELRYAHAAVRSLGPSSGVTWAVGSRQTVTWSGIGPVSVLLSVDGGNTYDTLLEGVTDNAVSVRVPHAPTRFARIRILRASPFSTSDTDSFIRIDATISLLKFEAKVVSAGGEMSSPGAASADAAGSAVALAWETMPSPPTIDGHRLERSGPSGSVFAPLHAGLLETATYTDAAPAADGARYRLIAVNGLGEEYVLGETSTAPALFGGRDLAVRPNPARDGRALVTFRVPYDAVSGATSVPVQVSVYDASGRLVRTLASGAYATGVQSAAWDGRDGDGQPVAAGTYFARMTSGSRFSASERVIVVR